MASLTQWTWVWASSRSWWCTGKPGVLQSMGSQRVGHESNWTIINSSAQKAPKKPLQQSKIQSISHMTETYTLHFSVHFSVLLSSVWIFVTHGLQHATLLCPSLSPGVCANSCPLSQWSYPTILSSVTSFSSCPQSFPASRFIPMNWLFTSGGQSIGASASVLSMNIQGWFSLGLTDLLAVQGILKSLLQHHSSKASVLQCSTLFMVQLSHRYMTTGKTIALALIIKAKFVIVTQLNPTRSTVYLALVSHPLLSDSSWMLFLDVHRTLYLPSF